MNGKKVRENIYHKNDKEWMTVSYQKDRAENWEWYYDNGNPYFKATIVNDQLQGRYQVWYENGQLSEELYFSDNIEN